MSVTNLTLVLKGKCWTRGTWWPCTAYL